MTLQLVTFVYDFSLAKCCVIYILYITIITIIIIIIYHYHYYCFPQVLASHELAKYYVPGGGGGGTLRYKGGSTRVTYFAEEGVFFQISTCPRFRKRKILFCTGWKSSQQSTKYTRLWRRVTPEVNGLPSLLPLKRQRIITSKVKMRVPVHPMSVFWLKKGCFFLEKVTFFFNNGAFLVWISALEVFLNFDNERMYPLYTEVPPPPPPPGYMSEKWIPMKALYRYWSYSGVGCDIYKMGSI